MSMIKLGETGSKKGLAIAGMIIGVAARALSLILLLAVNTAASSVDVQELNKTAQEMQNMKEYLTFEKCKSSFGSFFLTFFL